MAQNGNGNPDYYLEVSESIKSIFDLTSRIDERVKTLIKKQEELEEKMEAQKETEFDLDKRVKVAEVRLKDFEEKEKTINDLQGSIHKLQLDLRAVEIASAGQESKWKMIISFGVQLAWVVLAAYLLYKLGIQAPSVP